MGKGLIVIIIVVLIVLVVGGQYIGVKNTLVSKTEAVKGDAKQEQTVFDDIAKARSALLSARNPSDKIAANNQLDGALGRLLALSENYPQLKSNENFLRLQDELAGTENRIAVERKR